MKGLRVDSFLQCIPPRRLGHLFCKRRSAQANFYQFRRKVRGSGTIRPSLRYAISVCKVHFSRRPAFETSGLRPLTSIDKLSQAIKAIPFLILIEKVIRALPLSTAMLSLSLLRSGFFCWIRYGDFSPFLPCLHSRLVLKKGLENGIKQKVR